MLETFSRAYLILAGYGYESNGSVWLQVDDIGQYPTKRYSCPIKGQWFSLRPLNIKYCIGAYDPTIQRYLPCPQQKKIAFQYASCYRCSQVASFNPAFYHVPIERISAAQQQYNLHPHATYLAYFGERHLKVGISHEKRLLRRWLEQGARAAVILQVANTAYQARELEAAVSRLYRIPESITSQKKKKLLYEPYDFQVAEEALGKYQEMVHNQWNIEHSKYAVQNLQNYYFSDKQPTHFQELPEPKLVISGKCITMVGDILISKHQNHFFMQAIKSLIGKASIQVSQEELPLIDAPIQLF
jgi:hypothetical protein